MTDRLEDRADHGAMGGVRLVFDVVRRYDKFVVLVSIPGKDQAKIKKSQSVAKRKLPAMQENELD